MAKGKEGIPDGIFLPKRLEKQLGLLMDEDNTSLLEENGHMMRRTERKFLKIQLIPELFLAGGVTPP